MSGVPYRYSAQVELDHSSTNKYSSRSIEAIQSTRATDKVQSLREAECGAFYGSSSPKARVGHPGQCDAEAIGPSTDLYLQRILYVTMPTSERRHRGPNFHYNSCGCIYSTITVLIRDQDHGQD